MRLLFGGMRPFALALARPLETAHGAIDARRGWLVRLEDESGGVGFGEATPLASFGTESEARCEASLVKALESLTTEPATTLEQALARVARACGEAPCARAALDTALHDWASRKEGLPLADWLRRRAGLPGPAAATVRVQALIGGVTAEAVADAAGRAHREGFEAFKLKLAVSPARRGLELDLERVAALRSAVGSEARLRLDANEAWTRAEAEAALAALAPFEIDYVEQPVARDDLDSLAALASKAPIAVAADEALLGLGLEACLAREAVRVLVAKPAALAGVGPAARLAARTAERGLRLVWSTLLDGAVSRAAVWHLAAGLGSSDETHGIATGSQLVRDLVGEPPVRAGRLAGRPGPGLGIDAASLDDASGEPWLGSMHVFGGVS